MAQEAPTTELANADMTEQSQAVQITDSIIGQCIVGFDVCPLKAPIKYNNKVYDCMIREREAVIRDRIHAEQWSIGEFESVYIDAVRAFFIADTCRFGVLEMETTQENDFVRVDEAALTESTQLPVDCIVDSLAVKDYANVSHMLGKV
ncbi:hypothetical protein D0812_12740 [Vibrio owensii]|uniref:Uncharacterized protein n=1 Tax=Vibrio owensii TaxID=696485 RepID=A0ABM6ZFX0_9VIBR|nr:hypothetical protein [Vibrio owensii]AYO14433.1 hypothetical protein D0812_08440 [Vibrio owensii]AYO15236.1 hypothetical protein D0812_12740 [Vibrio owensii]